MQFLWELYEFPLEYSMYLWLRQINLSWEGGTGVEQTKR